jgi:hypothetical protein
MKKLLITILVSGFLFSFAIKDTYALVVNYSDLWDISQGTLVTESSGVISLGRSDIRNMFGGSFGSVDPASTYFQDGKSAGFLHWVKWQTVAPITLGSFNLVAFHDGSPRNINYRGFSVFRLFSGDGSGDWTNIYEYATDPDHDLDYGGGVNYPAQYYLELNEDVTPTLSQYFKAEFVQYGGIDPAASGPRIVELDGYAAPPATEPIPEPATMFLIGSGLIGLAGLRKKFFKK